MEAEREEPGSSHHEQAKSSGRHGQEFLGQGLKALASGLYEELAGRVRRDGTQAADAIKDSAESLIVQAGDTLGELLTGCAQRLGMEMVSVQELRRLRRLADAAIDGKGSLIDAAQSLRQWREKAQQTNKRTPSDVQGEDL